MDVPLLCSLRMSLKFVAGQGTFYLNKPHISRRANFKVFPSLSRFGARFLAAVTFRITIS
jgi:hypothetical protein